MMEEKINELKDLLISEGERFVNSHSSRFSVEGQETLNQFLSTLRKDYKNNVYIEVDIRIFENCEDEEEEATVFSKLINRELAAKGLTRVDIQAISIGHALHKWSKHLDRPTLVVFHCFYDRYDEKEKNILRSLRIAHRDKKDMSRYLSILILSTRPASRWSLYPESDLDDRHISFYEY